ncbi:DUF6233 domain-containing protein [Streptomyces sp. NPDC006610]|uniref:DUF6233 domain-containing protein n=1 Tax=Streptomyces sp. NPDC006610 TaxID=3154584 RepID=UPI00339E90A3
MTDLPPDLPRLRTLERWLALALAEVRQAIAVAEQREAERQRGIAARPPAPDWLLEQGLTGRVPVYVHAGGCHMAGRRSRPATAGQARQALAEGVDACPHCRPDTGLGYLDG